MLIDPESCGVLYVDAWLPGLPRATPERDVGKIRTVVSAVAARSGTKMSVATLAQIHIMARGSARAHTREAATIRFGIDDDSA
ncbi:MAG: hypothetical protein FWD68_03235 [Alphaproteobacteria bacterium]|nr:hypothetical protein [Alphaproteobacteria bacterium]